MALAYTAPTWVNGSGTGISASQLQALSDCMEGLVQGSDKAITNIAISGQTITLTFADGSQEAGTASGLKGISSIAKTGTSGLVDTYTITFTDGSTTTFTVTNGAQGEAGPQGPQGPQGIQGPAGDDGVSPEVTITTITGGHRVNITDADHPSGQNFDVMDGHDGASDWADITNKPNFATVATSGSYNDLSNKPSIPAAQVNSDWNAASGVAQILNKPTIPSITNCYQTTDTEKTALANADYVPFYAISASAKRKISWSNIKSVLKTYFDTLYTKTVANPTGTATGTLTKLGIGNSIYDIQGGGGADKADKTDIAPVESGTTASRAYAIDQQFYLNGSLYKAKTAIAQGATFTVGTNCELAGNITSQIPYTYAFNEYLQADQKLKLHVYSQRLTSDSSGFIILPSYIKPYLFVRAIVENDVNFCLAGVTTNKQQVMLRLFSSQMQPVTSAVTEVIRILYYTEE